MSTRECRRLIKDGSAHTKEVRTFDATTRQLVTQVAMKSTAATESRCDLSRSGTAMALHQTGGAIRPIWQEAGANPVSLLYAEDMGVMRWQMRKPTHLCNGGMRRPPSGDFVHCAVLIWLIVHGMARSVATVLTAGLFTGSGRCRPPLPSSFAQNARPRSYWSGGGILPKRGSGHCPGEG